MFEKFEYKAGLVNGIDAAIRLAELKKALQDRALSIFQGARDAEVATYDLAKAFLRNNLSYPHQIAIWRQEFHNRKKEEKETVADYLRDLRRLVGLAYSFEQDNAQTLLLKERFISGLIVENQSHPNYKLWKSAYVSLTLSLDELVAKVLVAETNQRMFSLTTMTAGVSRA